MKMQGIPYMPRHRSGGEISFFLITDCKFANRVVLKKSADATLLKSLGFSVYSIE